MMHCITKWCSGLGNAAIFSFTHPLLVLWIRHVYASWEQSLTSGVYSSHCIAALAARSSYLHLIRQLTDFLSAYSRSFLVLYNALQ